MHSASCADISYNRRTDGSSYIFLVIRGKKINEHTVLVGKSEGKITLGRSRHKWEKSIKVGLKELG